MKAPLRVGIIGCGEAAQALHIPALNSLAAQYRITALSDASREVAQELAGRTGARAMDDPAALITAQDGMTIEESHGLRYENGFRCEWQHLYDVAVNGVAPITSIRDAVQDLVLLEDIMRAMMARYHQGGEQ